MKVYVLGIIVAAGLAAGLAGPARAQTGDWTRLESRRHGSLVIVETGVNPYGPANFDRCRIKSVTPATLTCTTLGWAGRRLVFPAASIDAVYGVKQPRGELIFGCAMLGTFIGGAISGNPAAIAVGLIGGAILGFIEMEKDMSRNFNRWHGPPDPLPADEKHELLYLRPTVPTANH